MAMTMFTPEQEVLTAALKDDMAADIAEYDQMLAENQERRRFTFTVVEVMRERAAVFCGEVYDDVALALYGGHTPQTRRWIAEVEALAAEGAVMSRLDDEE